MDNLYRRTQILKLLRSDPEVTQEELRRKLARRAIQVTQATVSRDLGELGLIKTRTGYRLPEAVEPAVPVQPTLQVILKEFLREVSLASNLVVLKTHPGNA
ncbi:MAG: ArgR family transcriptional regulator, partial [Candidatus Binataceae bacterium]